MIIKRPADQKVYEYLIENYYSDFSIKDISKSIKKSHPMVYKSIALLKDEELVQEYGTKYKIDLSNHHTLKYKCLYDYEKFLGLPEKYKNKIYKMEKDLNSIVPTGVGFSLVIFGSLVDGSFSEESDIDVLLIIDKGINELSPRLPEGFHFLIKNSLGFAQEVAQGDDIALSICKCHIIIRDDDHFFIHGIEENKNQIGKEILEFKKDEARELKNEIMKKAYSMEKDEITKRLILEKLQKLIKIEARIICLEKDIIPTSKANSFKEASKIIKRDIEKEYNGINLENVLDKVASYV